MVARIPTNPVTDLFLTIIVFVLFGAAIIAYKLTSGYVAGYLKKDIPSWLKNTMFTIHSAGSLLLALILPNNYLVDIPFFGRLYKENGLWIGASMLMLLFMSVLVVGAVFSFLTRNREAKDDFLK